MDNSILSCVIFRMERLTPLLALGNKNSLTNCQTVSLSKKSAGRQTFSHLRGIMKQDMENDGAAL